MPEIILTTLMIISIIAAVDKNGLIGKGGSLPWNIPADLEHFKKTTWGHPIVMGRKTHESIGRELPGRTNVVISSNADYIPKGHALVATSMDQALEKLEAERVIKGLENDEVFVIGGGELYRTALPAADRLYITEIDESFEGDIYFPEFEKEMWTCQELGKEKDAVTGYDLRYLVYQRKPKEV